MTTDYNPRRRPIPDYASNAEWHPSSTSRGDVASCTCHKCVTACTQNPGWMSPEDARLALAAGVASRLMLDWLDPSSKVGNDERIYVLAPASSGREGDKAPEIEEMVGGGSIFSMFLSPVYKGRCTFLDGKSRCAIHDSGYKPKQCRESLACNPDVGLDNYDMARRWDTEEARAIIAEWRAVTGCEGV